MKFFIKPSPQSVIIVLIAIFLFFAATNIQAGWLYIIDSFLVSLLVFSFISPISQIRKLRFSRSFSKSIHENESLDVEVIVENSSKKILSFFLVTEGDIKRVNGKPLTIKTKDQKNFFVDVQPNSQSSFKYSITPSLRGVYSFDSFKIISYGPFGLFRYTKLVKSEDKVLVAPELPFVGHHFLSGSRLRGFSLSNKTRASNDASLPVTVREYRRGDPIKLIHWKSSAKRNNLMVKELESEQAISVQILLDTHLGNNIGFEKDSTLEYLLKLSGGILKMCIEKDYGVEFIYFNNKNIEKLSNVSTMKQVYDTLACIDANSNFKMNDLLKNPDLNHNSIIIPLFLNPQKEDIDTLNDLYNKNYEILPIFADSNSFDKNLISNIDIISKCNYKFIVIKKDDSLNI